MLAVASCTKEKAVTATDTNTETDDYGQAVRKIATLYCATGGRSGYFVPTWKEYYNPHDPNAYWQHGYTECYDDPNHGPCCHDYAGISTSVAHWLNDAVLVDAGTKGGIAVQNHFTKYGQDYIKAGLEADLVNWLAKGEATITMLGMDGKDNTTFYYEIKYADKRVDINLPVTGK